ncbi:MAG: hypothetical protein R3E53_18650 [Myxococcota bacterium]
MELLEHDDALSGATGIIEVELPVRDPLLDHLDDRADARCPLDRAASNPPGDGIGQEPGVPLSQVHPQVVLVIHEEVDRLPVARGQSVERGPSDCT